MSYFLGRCAAINNAAGAYAKDNVKLRLQIIVPSVTAIDEYSQGFEEMYNCKIRTYQEVSAVGAIAYINWHGLTFKTEHDMINFLLKWS